MDISYTVFKTNSSTWNDGSRNLEATIVKEHFKTEEAAHNYILSLFKIREANPLRVGQDRYFFLKIYTY